MFEIYEDIVTPEQLGEMLRMGMNQIYQLLNTRQIKAYREGRIWKIPKRAVEEYIIKRSGLGAKK